MNFISLAALFSLILFVSAYRFEYPSPSLRLLEELETELALGELGLPRSRPRRVSGPNAKACGKKIVKYVMAVCGEACEAGKTRRSHCTKPNCSSSRFWSRPCHALLRNPMWRRLHPYSLLPKLICFHFNWSNLFSVAVPAPVIIDLNSRVYAFISLFIFQVPINVWIGETKIFLYGWMGTEAWGNRTNGRSGRTSSELVIFFRTTSFMVVPTTHQNTKNEFFRPPFGRLTHASHEDVPSTSLLPRELLDVLFLPEVTFWLRLSSLRLLFRAFPKRGGASERVLPEVICSTQKPEYIRVHCTS